MTTPVLRTPVRCVEVNGITVVGERINPTGKKRLQQALREGDSAYACAQAVAQAEAGAELLDVNAGLPDIDEPATLEMLVRELQSITDLPLQLDSSNKDALARALRIYNGKADRQLGQRRAEGAGQHSAPVQKVRRRRGWSGTG